MSEWKETEYGQIPIEWDSMKIEELKAKRKYAISMGPFGSNIKADNFVSIGVPIIRGTNFNHDRYIGGEFVYLNEEKANELISSNCKAGDLVFTHRGTIGQVCLIPTGKYDRYVISQSGMKLSLDETIIDNEFLFYFFKSKYGQYQLLKNEAQVGVPSISNPLTTLKSIKVPVPPLPEQQAIASVLSSLDNKLDLLHRQNKTLEQLAETLFRQWFIEEADPSWDEKNLDELVEFNPREKIDFQKDYTFYEMKCLSNDSMSISDGVKRLVPSATSYRNGDTLLAKITPCLENGKIGFVMHLDTKEIGRGSTEFIVMRNKEKISPYWIYCLARSQDFRDIAILSMSGTSGRQRVQVDVLKDYKVQVNHDVMNNFHKTVHPYFDKIKVNQIQIRTLTQFRDTLLPKLMGGEFRVDQNE
jgi:type I restriction enzyme S subunit